jgi:protein gp37
VIRPLAGRGPRIDWAIAGCESGPGARPAKQPWFESLRDQCAAAGVPFFLKQMVVDGKLRKERAEFPSGLQIMEFPK